jgi:hypothetical protein
VSIFSGIVTLDGEDVPVTVGLDNQRLNLMSGDMEIGDWSEDDCSISAGADGKWLIEAESETLSFAPSRPDLFARAVSERVGESSEMDEDPVGENTADEDTADENPGGENISEPKTVVASEGEPEPSVEEAVDDATSSSPKEFEVVDGPPPRSTTMIGFYILAGITAILGVWAVISIFF